ncbi:hypothetical protein [Ulvibacter litoralis]|uniref:SatD family (SatD) n=1 Tax=Ulvibacter litoralis TaxID=227084 RepID=A0A1G7FD02_9FLAO|nr:hypothetical protein [Ulvibacter litoralis]GHC51697.1 hypothetical protein GCM10008083_14240 [Ulvibacter litoralis]SDE73724.1 hypothetical protein SAMN05421855_102480 [Ulvibacter litoralis]
MKNIAILSGDLINSSEYESTTLKAVVTTLKKEFAVIEAQYPGERISFSIYRGDSFQGVVENPVLALTIALQIKAAVNAVTNAEVSKSTTPIAGIRISIGIGEATYQKDALAESNGEAFQYSGRTLDIMKAEGMKMALTTANADVNSEFKVQLKFLDATTDRWSIASAEVVYFLLKGYKEQEIATELSRSQAAINLRKKAAGWDEIKLLLERYTQVAQQYFV